MTDSTAQSALLYLEVKGIKRNCDLLQFVMQLSTIIISLRWLVRHCFYYLLCIFSCVNFQFKAEITVKEDAQQFLATVSSEVQYNNHPHSGTTEDILKYTLITESMATAKIGCYSGTECLDMSHVSLYN